MADITVPISLGKGTTRFGSKLAQPEPGFPKTAQQATSTLEFLVNLSKNGRLVFFQNEGSTDDIIKIIPPEGTTFFFLGATIQNNSSGATVVHINNNGSDRERVELPNDGDIYEFKLKIDRLIGDGIKEYRLINDAGSSIGSMWGWFENTEEQTPPPASVSTD